MELEADVRVLKAGTADRWIAPKEFPTVITKVCVLPCSGQADGLDPGSILVDELECGTEAGASIPSVSCADSSPFQGEPLEGGAGDD